MPYVHNIAHATACSTIAGTSVKAMFSDIRIAATGAKLSARQLDQLGAHRRADRLLRHGRRGAGRAATAR